MSEQVRRRGAKPPPLSPESSVPPWGVRAYCPACGDVQRNYGNWRALYGERVTPHMREVAAAVKQTGQFSEAVTSVKCPGGIIDPVLDRAP